MKLRTILTALTAVSLSAASFSAVAQTASTPPTPKPAAGALPQTNPNAVQKSFRTQNAAEQQQSNAQSTTPVDLGPVGRSRSPN
jgi:hypothetical protein